MVGELQAALFVAPARARRTPPRRRWPRSPAPARLPSARSPRPRRSGGLEEVQREQTCLVFRLRRPRFQLLADPRVQLAPAAVREAFVRRVAGHHVPEAEGTVLLRQDEVEVSTSPRPRAPRDRSGAGRARSRADHGRRAEHAPGGRRQAVDLADHQRFDRVGKIVESSSRPAAPSSSVRNSGLPPAGRELSACRAVIGRSAERPLDQLRRGVGLSGSSHIWYGFAPAGTANIVGRSRRVATTSHGRATSVQRDVRRAARPRPRPPSGRPRTRARSAGGAASRAARPRPPRAGFLRNSPWSGSVSGVSGRSRPSGTPRSGSQGSR